MSSPIVMRPDGHPEISDQDEWHECKYCGRTYNSHGDWTMENECPFCVNFSKRKLDEVVKNAAKMISKT